MKDLWKYNWTRGWSRTSNLDFEGIYESESENFEEKTQATNQEKIEMEKVEIENFESFKNVMKEISFWV